MNTHSFAFSFLKKPVVTICLSLFCIATANAQAVPQDDHIYQGLGQKEGLSKIVDSFVSELLADQRIAHYFSKMDRHHFTQLLNDQFCELAGGPCKYKGKDMSDAHEGMGIGNAQFNAVAEDLQIAMEKNGVSTSISNQIVAKLAPMQRPIVTQ